MGIPAGEGGGWLKWALFSETSFYGNQFFTGILIVWFLIKYWISPNNTFSWNHLGIPRNRYRRETMLIEVGKKISQTVWFIINDIFPQKTNILSGKQILAESRTWIWSSSTAEIHAATGRSGKGNTTLTEIYPDTHTHGNVESSTIVAIQLFTYSDISSEIGNNFSSVSTLRTKHCKGQSRNNWLIPGRIWNHGIMIFCLKGFTENVSWESFKLSIAF